MKWYWDIYSWVFLHNFFLDTQTRAMNMSYVRSLPFPQMYFYIDYTEKKIFLGNCQSLLCFLVSKLWAKFTYWSLTGLFTAIRGFQHLLLSLFACTFASRAASSTLDDLGKQSTDLAKGGHITREDFTNLKNCVRKCGVDYDAKEAGQPRCTARCTRCTEVHTFSVTCTNRNRNRNRKKSLQ